MAWHLLQRSVLISCRISCQCTRTLARWAHRLSPASALLASGMLVRRPD